MIARAAIGLFLLTVLAAAQTVPATGKPEPRKPEPKPALMKAFGNYGEWWNALSEEGKDNFIDGYRTAMARVQSVTHMFAEEHRKSLQPGEPQPEFNERLKGIMMLEFLSSESNFTVNVPAAPDPDLPSLLVADATKMFREHLDDFYKDPRNRFIDVALALEYVRDDMTGRKTAGQLLDELNEWQKITKRDSR